MFSHSNDIINTKTHLIYNVCDNKCTCLKDCKKWQQTIYLFIFTLKYVNLFRLHV